MAARSPFLRRTSQDDPGFEDPASDPEMQAMAQVWAHPEDLHLYPVRLPALCRQISHQRMGVIYMILICLCAPAHLLGVPALDWDIALSLGRPTVRVHFLFFLL